MFNIISEVCIEPVLSVFLEDNFKFLSLNQISIFAIFSANAIFAIYSVPFIFC